MAFRLARIRYISAFAFAILYIRVIALYPAVSTDNGRSRDARCEMREFTLAALAAETSIGRVRLSTRLRTPYRAFRQDSNSDWLTIFSQL